jgi:hypothetical protein
MDMPRRTRRSVCGIKDVPWGVTIGHCVAVRVGALPYRRYLCHVLLDWLILWMCRAGRGLKAAQQGLLGFDYQEDGETNGDGQQPITGGNGS